MNDLASDSRLPQLIREAIHDLRNLFGVIGSASHLLSDFCATPKAGSLLHAIDEVAPRGAALTTELLAAGSLSPLKIFDLNERIIELEPVIRALLGPGIDLMFDLHHGSLPVHLEPLGFDATVIELVTNARAAVASRGRLVLRTRPTGQQIWFAVADSGRGIADSAWRRISADRSSSGANGTGLLRVKNFMLESNGRIRLRSAEGRDTVIFLILPSAGNAAFDEPTAAGRQSPQRKETCDEEIRRPIAA